MTEQELTTWIDAYGSAWERGDPDGAAELFSDDARYYETPFDPPALGPEGVRRYWSDATGTQTDVTFRYEILGMMGDRALVRWWATFVRKLTGARLELEGVLMLDFADDGRCRMLREWWHSVEHPPLDG
jgi:hypothetical protein